MVVGKSKDSNTLRTDSLPIDSASDPLVDAKSSELEAVVQKIFSEINQRQAAFARGKPTSRGSKSSIFTARGVKPNLDENPKDISGSSSEVRVLDLQTYPVLVAEAAVTSLLGEVRSQCLASRDTTNIQSILILTGPDTGGGSSSMSSSRSDSTSANKNGVSRRDIEHFLNVRFPNLEFTSSEFEKDFFITITKESILKWCESV